MRMTILAFGTLCLLLLASMSEAAVATVLLEPAMASSGDTVVFQAPAKTRSLRLIVNDGRLVLSADGENVFARSVASISAMTIRGNDLDNTLILDFAGGNPIPVEFLTFDGLNRGGDFDTIEIVDASLVSMTNDAQNGHDGDLLLELPDGAISRIHYLNIEPVDITGSTSADLVLNLSPFEDVFELVEISASTLQLQSIGSPTFETTIFAAPSSSLTLNGSANDTFVVGSPLALAFDVSVDGPLTLLNADLDANALIFNGDLNLNASVDFGIGGATPGGAISQYEQFVVNGAVAITGGSLSVSAQGGFTPGEGASFTIVSNDGADPVSGTFTGLPEGSLVSGGLAGRLITISYQGGDGNDIVLTTGVAACTSDLDCNLRGSCQVESGVCACFQGLTGASCDQCAADYYNWPTCTFCDAPSTCFGAGTCSATGSCNCNPGYTGSNCQECDAGFFGASCLPCPSADSEVCSGNGTCDDGFSGTGICTCAPGFLGEDCAQLPKPVPALAPPGIGFLASLLIALGSLALLRYRSAGSAR